MTYEPFERDEARYVDATGGDQELLADLEALVRLGLVETVVRGDGELSLAPLDDVGGLDDHDEDEDDTALAS